MPTYNAAAVADGVIAFEKGITIQQGRALRDNPIAIAEGATGAPKISGAAFGDQYWLGVGEADDTNYAEYTVDLSNVRWLRIDFFSGTIDRISLSANGGGTWGSDQSLFAAIGGTPNRVYIDLQTGDVLVAETNTLTAAAFTPLTDCDAVRFRDDSAVTLSYFDVYAIRGRA